MMHILLAVSVANALLADKDQHPHLSLDDILKKYEHHDTEKMESKFDDALPPLPKASDPASLHDTVLDMHQKTADMFDSIPTLEPVMHPSSPLSHHDRLSAILKGMNHETSTKKDDCAEIGTDGELCGNTEGCHWNEDHEHDGCDGCHCFVEEDDVQDEAPDCAEIGNDGELCGNTEGCHWNEDQEHDGCDGCHCFVEEDDVQDEAPDCGSFVCEEGAECDLDAVANDCNEQDHCAWSVDDNACGPAEDKKAKKVAKAAEGASDADAPKDAPADTDALPADKEAVQVSPEKAAKLAAVEKAILGKMGKSLKMMAMLHMMVQPMEKKLTEQMAHMPEAEKADAQALFDHIEKLDKLTGGAMVLVDGMKKAKNGTPKEKQIAVLKMITGMGAISKGVKQTLAEMKELQLAKGLHPGAGKEMTSKLHLVLQKMQAKVDAELADPARKGDPLVAIDVKMLDKMKKSVKKSEALMMVGAVAMKKAKTEEERTKIKTSVKGAMQKVMVQMKEDMDSLKQEAVVVLKAKMEKEEAEAAKAKADDVPDAILPDEPKDKKSDDGELKGLLDKIDGIPDSLLQKKAKETAAKDVPHLRAN
jgi:hypothetical protein